MNSLKVILILIIFITFISKLFANNGQTNNTNSKIILNQKAIEFSFGFSIVNSVIIEDQRTWLNQGIHYYPNNTITQNNKPEYEGLTAAQSPRNLSEYEVFSATPSISVLFPETFVFHPISFFGFGLIHELGCEFSFPHMGLFSGHLLFNIINKIKIINKFGNLYDKKNWFLLEYGVDLYKSYSFIDYNTSKNYPIYCDCFSIGPSIFLGYEKIYGNHFEFTTGLSFDVLYRNEIFDMNGTKYTGINSNMLDYYLGFEIRWKIVGFIIIDKKEKIMPTSSNSR